MAQTEEGFRESGGASGGHFENFERGFGSKSAERSAAEDGNSFGLLRGPAGSGGIEFGDASLDCVADCGEK